MDFTDKEIDLIIEDFVREVKALPLKERVAFVVLGGELGRIADTMEEIVVKDANEELKSIKKQGFKSH